MVRKSGGGLCASKSCTKDYGESDILALDFSRQENRQILRDYVRNIDSLRLKYRLERETDNINMIRAIHETINKRLFYHPSNNTIMIKAEMDLLKKISDLYSENERLIERHKIYKDALALEFKRREIRLEIRRFGTFGSDLDDKSIDLMLATGRRAVSAADVAKAVKSQHERLGLGRLEQKNLQSETERSETERSEAEIKKTERSETNPVQEQSSSPPKTPRSKSKMDGGKKAKLRKSKYSI